MRSLPTFTGDRRRAHQLEARDEVRRLLSQGENRKAAEIVVNQGIIDPEVRNHAFDPHDAYIPSDIDWVANSAFADSDEPCKDCPDETGDMYIPQDKPFGY